jgi:Secretion system C-terminal sorting domain
MKRYLLAGIAAFFYLAGIAQTTITSNIFNNTTWTLSGSPYLVPINLVVFDSITLTIDPGVEVRFGAGKELDLRGKLIAIGTAADSITFTAFSSNPFPGIWQGIRITGTANPLGVGNQVTMKYCKGLYADRFADMDLAYHGPYIFENCRFSYNLKVNHDGGMPWVLFSECKFTENTTALEYNQFGGLVRQSYFIGNTNGVDGFTNVDTCYFSGHTNVALSPYGAAVGNTVENNYIGVQCYFNAVNDSFIYNTVNNNSYGVDIESYFNGSILFQQNWICGNTVYNIRLLTANNADLSNNCWCAKDNQTIRSDIYDGYVNSVYGLVNFLPVASSCPQIHTSVDPVTGSSIFVNVYPNPSTGLFYVTYEKQGALIEVYDVHGKVIYTSEANLPRIEIDLTDKATGVYFLRISENGKTLSGAKIVKQ